MSTPSSFHQDIDHATLVRGRREGFATAALALACISFVNLFGAEKALLALLLSALALRGLGMGSAHRAWMAIGLAAMYLLTLLGILIIYRAELNEFARLLKDLG